MKTIFDAAYVLAIRTLFGGHAPSILISLWRKLIVVINVLGKKRSEYLIREKDEIS